ncbi:MAG: CFI-box-CTERM domain-containing protein [Candidatus Bathyarchaeia archaeon]
MEDNIIPGEHTLKVVCKDGTIGVIAYRFTVPIMTVITNYFITIITTPITTTTGCLIVSAAYGSNLAPAVKFIQNFRDNVIAKTFIDSAFMEIFNKFYYSRSSNVAKIIAVNSLMRDLTRVLFIPLFLPPYS